MADALSPTTTARFDSLQVADEPNHLNESTNSGKRLMKRVKLQPRRQNDAPIDLYADMFSKRTSSEKPTVQNILQRAQLLSHMRDPSNDLKRQEQMAHTKRSRNQSDLADESREDSSKQGDEVHSAKCQRLSIANNNPTAQDRTKQLPERCPTPSVDNSTSSSSSSKKVVAETKKDVDAEEARKPVCKRPSSDTRNSPSAISPSALPHSIKKLLSTAYSIQKGTQSSVRVPEWEFEFTGIC